MSGFKRFGIDHLSPSSLNCWQASPGVWALRYLKKVRDESNPAMVRGNAVEFGLGAILRGKTLEEARKLAIDEFLKLGGGEISDDVVAEANMIFGMVKQAGDWYADMIRANQLAPVAATQLRVETWLDGVSVPVIGYCDFTFMDDGPDIDLKTTKACPSKPKPDHLRQIALYAKARNKPSALLYVTDKKRAFFCPSKQHLELALADLTRTAQSLEQFLSNMPDADTAVACLPMDKDSYRFPKDGVALGLLTAGQTFAAVN